MNIPNIYIPFDSSYTTKNLAIGNFKNNEAL